MIWADAAIPGAVFFDDETPEVQRFADLVDGFFGSEIPSKLFYMVKEYDDWHVAMSSFHSKSELQHFYCGQNSEPAIQLMLEFFHQIRWLPTCVNFMLNPPSASEALLVISSAWEISVSKKELARLIIHMCGWRMQDWTWIPFFVGTTPLDRTKRFDAQMQVQMWSLIDATPLHRSEQLELDAWIQEINSPH